MFTLIKKDRRKIVRKRDVAQFLAVWAEGEEGWLLIGAISAEEMPADFDRFNLNQ